MKQFFFERPTNKLERKVDYSAKGKLPKQQNSSRPPNFFTLNTLCVARPEQKAKGELHLSLLIRKVVVEGANLLSFEK